MKDYIKNFFGNLKIDKRLAIIIVLGMTGILLLTMSELVPKDETKKAKNESEIQFEEYEENLEKRLTSIIGSIRGAGQTKVMVTLESGDENIYATENKKDDEKNENKYVIIENNGDDGGLLLKVVEPEIRGVAVVCEGADSAQVRQEIINTVTAVLGISTNRVNIAKISNGG
ncbi:MAG: hypothetical protein KBT46_08435 [Ruminococcus sp.]|nr:hypothetical protein [Candidatus Copronaster equi]